jgi:NAD+ diphosphatase
MLSAMPDFIPSLTPPAHVVSHRYFHVVGTSIWEHVEPVSPDYSVHFLGLLDGTACWGVDVPSGADPADGAAVDLRSYFGRVSEVEWSVAGRAVQLVEWARTHRYCGRCGELTEPTPGDRSMRCVSCGLLAYPRLAPAMITLVTRGDEALLARGSQWTVPMYSCLAGFVEPGETLEHAVAREVREEVGIEVRDITYWGSQPWPFPHSLMLGFHCAWDGGEIEIDPSEILDAGWFTRDALPMIPPRISIARKLIDAWVEGA